MFKPSLDIYQDNNKKYYVILWYTPLYDRENRKFINIIGGN